MAHCLEIDFIAWQTKKNMQNQYTIWEARVSEEFFASTRSVEMTN